MTSIQLASPNVTIQVPEERTALDQIKENCRRIFPSMTAQLGPGKEQEFALYFIEKFCENIESCQLDPITNAFTITLAKEQKKKHVHFTLYVRKQIKGSFNFDEHKISFEHESIIVDCPLAKASLHSIGKNPRKEKLTIQGKKLGILGITCDKDFSVKTLVKALDGIPSS